MLKTCLQHLKIKNQSKNTFNQFQHHCRNCGAVVCGPCSSKKFLLAGQSTKPLRVCLDCYDKLSSMKTEQVSIKNELNK